MVVGAVVGVLQWHAWFAAVVLWKAEQSLSLVHDELRLANNYEIVIL